MLFSDDLNWLSSMNSLEYLDMSCVDLFDATNWLRQINLIPTLRVLLLGDASLPYVPPPYVPTFNLTSIAMLDLHRYGWNISASMLRWLSNASKLEHLDLSSCFAVFDAEALPVALGALHNLRKLVLYYNNIEGEISTILKNVSRMLQHLDLGWNPLLPGEISTILSILPKQMEILALDGDNIYGRIPEVLGNYTSLRHLDIWRNQITGDIPKTIGKLIHLEYFDASSNNLTGQTLKSFGRLCNLSTLHLSSNNINGELSDLFDGLSDCPQGAMLSSLHIADNNLSGNIPSNLGLLAQLEELDLSSNSLQGNMTETHFYRLKSLSHLNISFNSLNVVLPNDWHPPFNASTIDMSSCHLGGTFPSWIQSQRDLFSLYLSNVGLSGRIPLWFSNFIPKVSLYNLDLSSNNLTGPIPSTLSPFTDLSNNSFEGTIPASLENANYLQILVLSDNHISGSFPPFLCNLSSLVVIDLSNNLLSGTFPQCQSSFPLPLEYLHLNNNSISGQFPSFLEKCESLITLDLGENKFSGEIPTWVPNLTSLQILRLSSNYFTGVIPIHIGYLTSLKVLDLSFNKLSGKIPSSVRNFSTVFQDLISLAKYYDCSIKFYRCGRAFNLPKDKILITAKGSTNEYITILSLVTSIDLSHNNLSGEIPKEMMMIHGLHFLSLSNNRLTGRIPENIGTMLELFSLDLSMNNLTGTIPSNLSALTSLEHLNLSFNNLSGRIPTGNQLKTFDDPAIYAGNKDLCGWPLPECLVMKPSEGDDDDDDGNGDKLEKVLDFAFIAMGFIVGFWAYWGTMILKKSIRIALFRMVDRIYDWIYVQLSVRFRR